MAQNRNILFSVPTNDKITPQTALAIACIAQRKDLTYMQVMGSPTDQVRNGLARKVLENEEYTHLMMMDSDIEPPSSIVDLLLECNSPMASAIVPIYIHSKLVTNIVVNCPDSPDETAFMEEWDLSGEPFEVEGVGTGCVLIAREVIEAVPWPWFRYQETYPEGRRIGEDIYFSRKAKEHGYKFKVHPKAICGHYKTVNLMDIVYGFRLLAKEIKKDAERCIAERYENHNGREREAEAVGPSGLR